MNASMIPVVLIGLFCAISVAILGIFELKQASRDKKTLSDENVFKVLEFFKYRDVQAKKTKHKDK